MAKSQSAKGTLRVAEFLTETNKELEQLGGNEEMMLEKMKNGTGLAKDFARLIVAASSGAKKILRVLSSLSLHDRIARRKYDWVNSDITEAHFPTSIPADYDVEYRLYEFNHEMGPEDIIKEMDADGFRPGNLAELLALDENEPELQKPFLIAAIGSKWLYTGYGFSFVSVLGLGGVKCSLCLGWFGGDELELVRHRFLAVRK